MSDRKLGSAFVFPPLPPYASSSDILRRTLPSLSPAKRLSVVDAAEQYLKVNANGRWVDFDRTVTPYMVEPADMLTSRLYQELVFAGPARAGKTVMLMQGVGHKIICDPGVVHITHMTKDTGEKWVDEELLPMIENSPALAKRQGLGRSDRNILSKKFVGGTKVTIGPPTAANFRGRTIHLILVTDLDQMNLSIGGEGSAFAMASKRTETAGSRGMSVAESSPGHSITDPDWKAETVHQAPPCAGILGLFNEGTRARWYWECPCCGAPFEAHFKYLKYDDRLPPAEAGEMAFMQCPHKGCGGVIEHKQKVALNRAGYWLHETSDGGVAKIDSGDVRKSERLSYHLNGAAATFASWKRLVSKYETARRHFKATGDEEDLRVTLNTDQGVAFLPHALRDEGVLTVEMLQSQAKTLPQKVAPEWTRFLTVGVDVQKGKFVCQVMAFGTAGERIPIDRFELATPPDGAPRADERALDPAKYVEDWEVLRALLTTAYPVENAKYALVPMAVACDFHGQPGVSDRAEEFWRKRVRDGETLRWYMVRGHGGFKVPDRVWYKAPTRASTGKAARSIKLLNIATDKFKDTLFAALQRIDGGPGSQAVPSWMQKDHLREFTAEQRGDKGYTPRKNMPRNEAIDISVYATAVAEFKGMNRIDETAPPSWAVGGPMNEFAVPITANGIEPVEKKTAPARPTHMIF